ncbi:MAG: LamG domain-containing protein [Betaproteobacteria bacterium]
MDVTAGTGTGDDKQILLSNNAVFNVDGNVNLNGNGNDNRIALLQLNGATVTIGGALNIAGGGGTSRARVTLANTSTLDVTGDVVIGAGSLLDNGSTATCVLNVSGDFTHTGTYSSTGGTSNFVGAGAQAINGSTAITTTFFRVTFNNTGGDITINHPVQVANGGTLTLTSGRIVTAANYVAVGATGSATLSGGNTNSYVIGNVRRYIPTGTQSGIMFPVGGTTAGKYAPVQIDFPNVTTAGLFQVAAATGNADHPNISSSAIDPAASVNRYWTLTNTGGLTFSGVTTANATFNYPASDIDSGADPTVFTVGDFGGGAWTYPATGTLTATSSQVTGLTAAAIPGDYAIGELVGPYSYWRMNENSWNGTANEVLDLGSGGNPGNAASLSATKPTTANATPAIAGSPGTCRYGVFNRNNKDYISLPTTYPDLATQSFTITAWIRTTDNTQPGQRILIDDEGSAGGWGFSLGDGATAALRIYSRGSSTNTLDTGAIIANNTWYFVAATMAINGTTTVVTIYVYNTSGALVATPTTATWTGYTWGNDTGRPSLGGETNASGEGNNAFGFAGNLDEIRVYRAALSQNQVNQVRQLTNPCQIVDHYALVGSTTAVTCDTTAVQIIAHDAAHTAVAPSAGTVLSLSTSTNTGVWQPGLLAGSGGWAPSGANNGAATYTWPGGESTFNVSLRQTTVATVNINLSDINGKTEAGSEDLTISFVDSAFRVTTNGTSTATVGTQLSAKNSNVGFGAQTLYLQAIRTDTSTGSCVGLIQSQTVTVEMAAARVNPTGSASQVSVMNSASAMVALGTGAGAAGTYTGVSLAFDATSKAPLIINYPNAGSVSLFARYALPTPGTGTISGTSNAFVVRPFGLRISGPPSGISGPTSAVYAKAGQTWPQSLTVTAVAWEAADDTNNDGIPDSDAALVGNATTSNFGAETSAATATVTHTLVEPVGGASGALTATLSAFSSGVATASANFSEVGIINLFANSASYLGTGQAVRNSTAGYTGVGRFYPFDFAITRNTPSFTAACSANFTYVGQPFSYAQVPIATVTARNATGVTTQNYAGTFAKIVSGSITPGLTASRYARFDALGGGTTPVLDTSLLPAAGADPAISTFTSGVGTLTFNNGGGAVFTRSAQVGPFNADIALTFSLSDSDGVTPARVDGVAAVNPIGFGVATSGNGIAFATSKGMRFGRLSLSNAFGSEVLDLPVPMETQYFSNGVYQTNTLDNCTTLTSGNLSLSPTGVTTAVVGSAFVAGKGNLKLTKPGVAASISLCVDLDDASPTDGTCVATGANLPWLQWRWSGSAYDRDPKSRANFGLHKNADEFIYFRELY